MNIFSKQTKIGIIGYGKFGKLIESHLFFENKLFVYSPHLGEKKISVNIVPAYTIEDVMKHVDLVIPAVPMRYFSFVIQEIAPFIQPHQVVMDICSIKEYPIKTMQQYLPKKSQIIGSHPMFGPTVVQFNNNSVKDLRMVLMNISAETQFYETLYNYLQSLNLHIIELSAKEHDEMSSRSHFFTKIVKHLITELHLKKTPIDTPSTDKLFDALEYTTEDNVILEDMIRYNAFSDNMLQRISQSLLQLQKTKGTQ